MKRILTLTLGGIAAALLSFSSLAQMGPGMGGQQGGGGPGMMGGQAAPATMPARDCSKARNPAQCEARQKARAACQGQRGAARRDCMEDQMPPPDCSKARYPERCEAMAAARAACKGKMGKDRRQCMRDQAKATTAPQAPAAPASK